MAIGLAIDAVFCLSLGTAALFNGNALFYHDYFLFTSPADKLKSGKNAGRSGSDDYYICFHV